MSEHPHTQLTAYLDQELDSQQQAMLESHLQVCAACRSELDEQLALRLLLETLPPAPQATTSVQFWQELEPQLQPRRTRLGLAWLWGVALVAAVVVVHAYFIALRLAQVLNAAGWLPALQSPVGSGKGWGMDNLPGAFPAFIWNNSLINMVLESPIVSPLPYLLTLVVSSVLALIFLGWAYAYLCPQSPNGCQPIRE